MKIIKVYSKDVVASQVELLDLCDNEQGNTVVGDVYLDITSTNSVKAEGSVDGENWHTLKMCNMGTFETADAATEAGYYMVPASGLAKLKFTFGNAGHITVKETF